jgi:hypothetical protein
MRVDHVAVLVEEIESAVETWGLPIDGTIEEFPREGTRELYCGADGASFRLLLMQPIGPGPYERAMAKRGAGLHHIAFCVPDLSRYVNDLEGSGWLMHPASLRLRDTNRQVWLCRPGVPVLIELNEGAATYDGAFIEGLWLSVSPTLFPLISALECEELHPVEGTSHSFVVNGQSKRIVVGNT